MKTAISLPESPVGPASFRSAQGEFTERQKVRRQAHDDSTKPSTRPTCGHGEGKNQKLWIPKFYVIISDRSLLTWHPKTPAQNEGMGSNHSLNSIGFFEFLSGNSGGIGQLGGPSTV